MPGVDVPFLVSKPISSTWRIASPHSVAYPINGLVIPCGKHTKNDGKSPCFMGKSTISMAIFNSKLLVYQRVTI